MIIMETAKQPRLKVWRNGKIAAEFIPEERGHGEGKYEVGIFRTDDEELVRFIKKNCESSDIVIKRLSSGELNTVGVSHAKKKLKHSTTAGQKRTAKRL